MTSKSHCTTSSPLSQPGDRTTRRQFLRGASAAAGLLAARRIGAVADSIHPPADVVLRIAPLKVDIARGQSISTIGYNGAVPGPLIRFREGVTASVEIFNETDLPEYVHWHGFEIPTEVDGAEEEGSLVVPAHGRLRYRLTPTPAGSRYVHTHAMSMANLDRGTFTGQFGPVWIEPGNNPGRYDQEISLATHEWGPYLSHQEEEVDSSAQHGQSQPKPAEDVEAGCEVHYRHFTINGKCLGFGDPIRVKEGQRVLFHILNASATENVRLALPGHKFQVVALDGNPVPRPQSVEVLELGTAERIDAVVTMNSPGVFILGTPNDNHRKKGMGIVVEYANRSGAPQWLKPAAASWDYTIFGETRAASKPGAAVPLVFRKRGLSKEGIEEWSINGKC